MRNKGRRLEQFLSDYVCFDIETCGLSQECRKNIIEISALRVANGEVSEEFSSLVKPSMKIPPLITDITGIDNDMVIDAPSIRDVLSNFLAFIGDSVLLGYNINSFDYNVVYDLVFDLFGKELTNDFVDIIYAARCSVKDTGDTKLTTLCKYFNIDSTGSHRALRDCYLTKSVYEMLNEKYGKEAFSGNKYEVDQRNVKTAHFTYETKLLQELQNILISIVEDGEVSQGEVHYLNKWIRENIHLSGNYPFDRIYGLLELVMADGVIDRDELLMLMDKFNEYIDPAKTTCENARSIAICDNHFVLTGNFQYGSRSAVEQYIISMGGIIDGNVKKTTNYVIVGSLGSQSWKNGNYGDKIKKAIELRDKGNDINIVEENDFFGDD